MMSSETAAAATAKGWDDPLGLITPEVIEAYRRDGVVSCPRPSIPNG